MLMDLCRHLEMKGERGRESCWEHTYQSLAGLKIVERRFTWSKKLPLKKIKISLFKCHEVVMLAKYKEMEKN